MLLSCNLYKELKLNVVNDVVHDAGGLLREWSALIFKQLGREYGVFEISCKDTGHYRFSTANHTTSSFEKSEEYKMEDSLYILTGRVLAKTVI